MHLDFAMRLLGFDHFPGALAIALAICSGDLCWRFWRFPALAICSGELATLFLKALATLSANFGNGAGDALAMALAVLAMALRPSGHPGSRLLAECVPFEWHG